MASRRRWMVSGVLGAALGAGLLAIATLPGADREGGHREVGEQRVEGAALVPATGGNARLPPAHGTEPGAEPETATVSPGADELAAGLAKLVRDLEYTPGLPEPVQQAVNPQPEPWRGDPSREGPPPIIEALEPVRLRTAGGDRVTIRGRNLRVVQVMFGTSPARLLAASGTLVAVEAPPSEAGPVTIAVTNDDGTFALAETPVDYVP